MISDAVVGKSISVLPGLLMSIENAPKVSFILLPQRDAKFSVLPGCG